MERLSLMQVCLKIRAFSFHVGRFPFIHTVWLLATLLEEIFAVSRKIGAICEK